MYGGGGLAPRARSQLAAWEEIAAGWPLYGDRGPAPGALSRVELCRLCDRGVILIRDEQYRPYEYTDEQRLALIVLHLRNHHPDLDPDTGP